MTDADQAAEIEFPYSELLKKLSDTWGDGIGFFMPPEKQREILYTYESGNPAVIAVPKRGARNKIARRRGMGGYFFVNSYDFVEWKENNGYA